MPLVVFVHGLDSWSGTWHGAATALAARGIPSLAVDLRGHGQSPMGDPADFGPAQLAADVRAALLREACGREVLADVSSLSVTAWAGRW